ncbi:alkaline shock response membrane anchor protein AmaP [Thermaerobacter litoralis]
MGPWNAALAVLNSLLLAGVGAVLLAAALAGRLPAGLLPAGWVPAPGLAGGWVTVVVGLFFLLSGLHVTYHALRPRRRDAVSAATELGEVRTALAAVEELVRRTGLQVAGVREVRPQVHATRDGIRLRVRAEVLPDHPIPDVAPQLQARLREAVETIVGARVAEVRVVVERFAGERRRRAE